MRREISVVVEYKDVVFCAVDVEYAPEEIQTPVEQGHPDSVTYSLLGLNSDPDAQDLTNLLKLSVIDAIEEKICEHFRQVT